MKRNVTVGVNKPHISKSYGFWVCWFGIEGNGGMGFLSDNPVAALNDCKVYFNLN